MDDVFRTMDDVVTSHADGVRQPITESSTISCRNLEEVQNHARAVINTNSGGFFPTFVAANFSLPATAEFRIPHNSKVGGNDVEVAVENGEGSSEKKHSTATSAPPETLLLNGLQILNSRDNVKEQEKICREVAKVITQAIAEVDGFGYSLGSSWKSKTDGHRFTFICQDSLQNRDRKSNISSKAKKNGEASMGTEARPASTEPRPPLVESTDENKRKGQKGSKLPTYDCGGMIRVKFNTTIQNITIYYGHAAIHRTVASRRAALAEEAAAKSAASSNQHLVTEQTVDSVGSGASQMGEEPPITGPLPNIVAIDQPPKGYTQPAITSHSYAGPYPLYSTTSKYPPPTLHINVDGSVTSDGNQCGSVPYYGEYHTVENGYIWGPHEWEQREFHPEAYSQSPSAYEPSPYVPPPPDPRFTINGTPKQDGVFEFHPGEKPAKIRKKSHPTQRNPLKAPQERSTSTSDKPRAPRSRTGCLTCRHRRMKCDEEFPVCTHCTKSKRECVYSEQVLAARALAEASNPTAENGLNPSSDGVESNGRNGKETALDHGVIRATPEDGFDWRPLSMVNEPEVVSEVVSRNEGEGESIDEKLLRAMAAAEKEGS